MIKRAIHSNDELFAAMEGAVQKIVQVLCIQSNINEPEAQGEKCSQNSWNVCVLFSTICHLHGRDRMHYN